MQSENRYLQANRAQDHSWMSKWSYSNLYSTFPLRCSAMAFTHSLISLISCFSQSTSLLVNATASRFSEGLEVFWQNFNQYSCLPVSVWYLALAISLLVNATHFFFDGHSSSTLRTSASCFNEDLESIFSISITAWQSVFGTSPWNAVPIHWPPLYSNSSSFQILSLADVDVIERALVPCWVEKAALTISEQLNLVDVIIEIATLTVSE